MFVHVIRDVRIFVAYEELGVRFFVYKDISSKGIGYQSHNRLISSALDTGAIEDANY